MIKLALRNLIHERTRLVISVSGVALSFMLILIMAGIFAGSEEIAVAYIKNQPSPLWLMQDGVENMHMSSSILPPETISLVQDVAGVEQAVGVLYANAGVELDDTMVFSYVFGIDPGISFGGPWDLVEGTSDLEETEVVIDRLLANRYGIKLGDEVNILGLDMTIAGLSEGTFGLATNVTFVNKQALAWLMGVSAQAASYILIQPDSGVDQETLAATLQSTVPEANILSQDDFIASDQEMLRQMGTDVIRAINMVAYIVGLLVIGLTIYIATLERTREYGVLKAIGANNGNLLLIVFIQAFVSAGLGMLVGVGLSYSAGSLISFLYPDMLVIIEFNRVLGQVPVLAVVTALAALMPIGRVFRLDPMIVFNN